MGQKDIQSHSRLTCQQREDRGQWARDNETLDMRGLLFSAISRMPGKARERWFLSDRNGWYLEVLWTLLSQTGIKSNYTFHQLSLLLTRRWEHRKREGR